MDIVVGSTSEHKLGAVKQACVRLGRAVGVSGTKTASGQNEQPVGLEETYSGALTRAQLAKRQYPDRIAIGIESGILRIGRESPMTIDIAVIVVLPDADRCIVTTSQAIVFPERCVELAESRGFATTTVGSVIAEEFGGDATDPHATLTDGRVRRMETLVDAVALALRQI